MWFYLPFPRPRRDQEATVRQRSLYAQAEFCLCDILRILWYRPVMEKCHTRRSTRTITFSDWLGHYSSCDGVSIQLSGKFRNSPPRIVSTDLLPVLMIRTRRLLSWTSRPDAKEEPYKWCDSALMHWWQYSTITSILCTASYILGSTLLSGWRRYANNLYLFYLCFGQAFDLQQLTSWGHVYTGYGVQCSRLRVFSAYWIL